MARPESDFTATVTQGAAQQQMQLNFTKFGHDGVWIESRRNAGTWEFLAIDTVKPYTGDRPLLVPGTAETREYRLRWRDNDDWSPVQNSPLAHEPTRGKFSTVCHWRLPWAASRFKEHWRAKPLASATRRSGERGYIAFHVF